jgi:hypothetical protein
MAIANPIEAPERFNIPAERLRRAFKWVGKAKELPPRFVIAINATIWLERVDAFRKLEEDLLVEGEYKDSLDVHRAALSQLIAEGVGLVSAAKKIGVSKFPSGFALSDLESTVDSLHLTFRCQHGPKNSRKTNKTIAKLLNAA